MPVDQDAGQIAAINEAWSQRANILLCLWHVERAIDRKLRESKHKSSQYTAWRANEANRQFSFIDVSWIPEGHEYDSYSEENIKEILKMVKKHSLLHPLIPINEETFFTSTEIYHKSVVETYTYCRERNFIYLWAYLWINWYNWVDWNLFARASFPSAISLARTTMLVESHWRVLKYNYKYTCNRPRLDRLTQILTRELLPDQISTWEKFNNNRAFPSWWGMFKSEWRKALDTNVEYNDRYLTNVDTWICSCPAFINNTYMLCKHLVKAYTDENPTFPQYATTHRRHDYPFIQFGEACSRIDTANRPWTESSQNLLDEMEISMDEDNNNSLELNISARNELIESRLARLEEDRKTFESLVAIATDNIQNDDFYNEYAKLTQTLVKETKACQEALMARSQQQTWNPPRNSRLAFRLR